MVERGLGGRKVGVRVVVVCPASLLHQYPHNEGIRVIGPSSKQSCNNRIHSDLNLNIL